MKTIIDNLNELEDYLINKSELSIEDTQNVVGYLSKIRLEAINFTHSSTKLPTDEEMTLEKRKTFKRINDGIMTIDKMSYGLGFRKCFSWLNKDADY